MRITDKMNLLGSHVGIRMSASWRSASCVSCSLQYLQHLELYLSPGYGAFRLGKFCIPQQILGRVWKYCWLSRLLERTCYWHVMGGGQWWVAKHPAVQDTAHHCPQMYRMLVMLRLRKPVLDGWRTEWAREIRIQWTAYVNLTSKGYCHSRR